MKVGVAGTGYVGLVTGVALAQIGHHVTCVDIDENKINIMKSGKSPIYEKDLEKLMLDNKERLDYTTDYKKAYRDADVIIVGVGTPERADGSANLDYVNRVCEQIADSLEKDCVVVIKSTVPVGTNDKIEKKLKESVKNGIEVYVASNPEFLSQGTAVHDTLHATRIVVGTENEKAAEIMKKLYEPLTKEPYNVPYLATSRKSAEMIKYASNDFLALKISYINEIANLCKLLGANVEEVATGMGYDPRIGNKFLKSGIGYGGSCFPKDTKALHWLSQVEGVEIKTIKACIEVNEAQKVILFKEISKDLGDLRNKTIAVLGLTFKPGTDDLRDAPSIDNIKLLLDVGAHVKAYDPVGIENFKNKVKFIVEDDGTTGTIDYYTNIDEAIKDSDAALIMTEWPDIKNYNIDKYKELMKTPRVYDGRNCYALEDTKDIIYSSIGR